jgi:hypothetical protein
MFIRLYKNYFRMGGALETKICINLDKESFEITRTYKNISAQIRSLIIESEKGLRPLCLNCGKMLFARIGTTKLECDKCKFEYQLKIIER